jgi:hypothetical protein
VHNIGFLPRFSSFSSSALSTLATWRFYSLYTPTYTYLHTYTYLYRIIGTTQSHCGICRRGSIFILFIPFFLVHLMPPRLFGQTYITWVLRVPRARRARSIANEDIRSPVGYYVNYTYKYIQGYTRGMPQKRFRWILFVSRSLLPSAQQWRLPKTPANSYAGSYKFDTVLRRLHLSGCR